MPSLFESCNPYALSVGPAAPGSPIAGDAWWDTTSRIWRCWNGTAWVATILMVTPPIAANSPGIKGQMALDDWFMYFCVDTNTWKRAALATW